MNTPFPCYNCAHLYVDCLQKDNPEYLAECKLSLPMGKSRCEEFTRWIDRADEGGKIV